MFLNTLTTLVKVDVSDIVMINHVLHDYHERMKDTIRHHSMWLYLCTTSRVHNIVVYVGVVCMFSNTLII